MPRRRLGAALVLTDPVATEVDGLRRALGDPALDRIAPHITLVPPVNVREDDVGTAWALLRRAAAATAPLHLEVGPIETFAPVRPVLYLAVGGRDLGPLRTLQEAVFRGPLHRSVDHDYVPHVTVAAEATPERIAAARASLGAYRRDVVCTGAHLLEERRRDDGRRVWEPVAEGLFASREPHG